MKAIYKCRLCGEIYSSNSKYDYQCANNNVLAMILDIKPTFTKCPTVANKSDNHYCKDGSIGFADFQGFKKEEKET